MWDYLRARKQGKPFRGNGRRESYRHLPMVRMTNTFVLDGPDDEDDIVRATDYGVYVAEFGGGQVNPATGDFVFGMLEAYLIENGEITEPLREGNLIGNGPQVLRDIDMIAGDFAMGRPGTCGKDGQGVPVGDGCPTLRVKRADRRRDRGVSERSERAGQARPAWPGNALNDLAAIAAGIIDQAHPGEQIEAYVSRGGETQVRIYEGEVEKYVSAESEGVGVRVIRDGRTGFAYAGTLDDAAVAEVLAEARDNVEFGTVDEWAGLAEPDGVPVTEQELWSDALAGVPERPQDRARPRAGAPRPRRRPAHPHGRHQLRRRLVRACRRHDDGDPAQRALQRLLRDGVDARRRGVRDADRLRLQRRARPRRARPRRRRRRRRRPGRCGCSAPPSRRASASPSSSRRS